LTTFQIFGSHNFLFQYGAATNFARFVDNLFGFTTLLTESKYYISLLRYVSSNDMVYFSPHALFSQARSHLYHAKITKFYNQKGHKSGLGLGLRQICQHNKKHSGPEYCAGIILAQ